MESKLFIVIDRDLPVPYQGVQGAHAAVQWLLENQEGKWKNDTLVFLESDRDLHHWREILERTEMKYTGFHEPDLGNQLTALAVLSEKRNSPFKKLKLIGSTT